MLTNTYIDAILENTTIGLAMTVYDFRDGQLSKYDTLMILKRAYRFEKVLARRREIAYVYLMISRFQPLLHAA